MWTIILADPLDEVLVGDREQLGGRGLEGDGGRVEGDGEDGVGGV